MSESVFCQIIGAGPAGMSLVLALCNRIAGQRDGYRGAEREILDSLLMFEASTAAGGKMGHNCVNANTDAHDVVKGIADGTPFVEVRDRYLGLDQTQSPLIPLATIETQMIRPLAKAMGAFLGKRLRCGVAVERIVVSAKGFESYTADDELLAPSRQLVLCCGGSEPLLPELSASTDTTEASGDFLLRQNLDGLRPDRADIVIIGASHSAFSCAWRLLHDPLYADFSRGRKIIMLQRRERVKLRCTPEFAARHNVEYDAERDVCPVSGLVYFNAGLRKDAKMLYLRIRDGEGKRVRLVSVDHVGDQRDLLDQAGLILQATGFQAKLPPIEMNGRAIAVGNPTPSAELRSLTDDRVIPGLFGMGLGLNILPRGEGRCDKSFSGGIHGFQSYPLAVAPLIINHMLAGRATEIAV